MFKLEDVETELSLEFAPKAGIGFDAYVFKSEVGAEAKGAHKLALKFEPNREIIAAALTDAPGTVMLSPKVSTSKSGNPRRRASGRFRIRLPVEVFPANGVFDGGRIPRSLPGSAHRELVDPSSLRRRYWMDASSPQAAATHQAT